MIARALLTVLLFAPVFAWAEPALNLYVQSVPVGDQELSSRNKAAGKALAPVLVRASGSSAVLLNGEIQAALNKASRYLNQFSYSDSDVPAEEVLGEDGLPLPVLPYSLQLEFRKSAILNLLRSSGEPIWAENRPETLVWLVIDDINGRRMPIKDDESGVRSLIEANAARRGLPVAWPVYDLKDQFFLTLNQLWEADAKAIQQVSERYEASGILLGRLLGTSDGRWRIAWEYSFEGGSRTYWDSECDKLEDCVSTPIDAVAELLSARYAVVSTNRGNEIIVDVTGVESFDDYGTLMFYFKNLVAVNAVAVNSIRGNTLTFTLSLSTNVEKLAELISLNKSLQLQSNVADPNSDLSVSPNKLVYQWH